ncbi:hypothetical protein [Streptomyces chartreusis]
MLRGLQSEDDASPAAAADTPSAKQLELEEENWHLRRALESRPCDRYGARCAGGDVPLLTRSSLRDPGAASQHANVKLRLIAQALVDPTQGKKLPGAVRAQVTAAVDAVCGADGPVRSAFSGGVAG